MSDAPAGVTQTLAPCSSCSRTVMSQLRVRRLLSTFLQWFKYKARSTKASVSLRSMMHLAKVFWPLNCDDIDDLLPLDAKFDCKTEKITTLVLSAP